MAIAAKTAKLFANGRSQAVRLPREFRFAGKEVAIRRNEETGEVVLAALPAEPSAVSFDKWIALYSALPDDASEEQVAKLPPAPKNLTTEQLYKIFDAAHFPADFMADRKTSMPREFDLF